MRAMASIRKIAETRPIPGADRIWAYRVDGWWVVDGVGKYMVGDLVIYCEVDSWIPHSVAPFLSKGKVPREYEGIAGERLRTVKFRGQVSQGMLLPLEVVELEAGNPLRSFCEGEDVSTLLNIRKWEAPIPAQLAGEVIGEFPSFIRKTDQERIQNLTEEFANWQINDSTWEVTEKMDGSSMTVFVRDNESGVCSRNLNLKENDTNTFWTVAKREMLIEKIRGTGLNIALQGELCGEGIQKNPYKLKGQHFFLYDIFDIDRQVYLSPKERRSIVSELNLSHVPVLVPNVSLQSFESIDSLLQYAEAGSVFGINVEREGLVFKCNEWRESFKVISNKFLLKGGE